MYFHVLYEADLNQLPYQDVSIGSRNGPSYGR